jgi:hypothetical protein
MKYIFGIHFWDRHQKELSEIALSENFKKREMNVSSKDLGGFCGDAGRSNLRRLLTNPGVNPWITITDVQSKYRMSYTHSDEVYDVIEAAAAKVSRKDFCCHIFESCKRELLQCFPNLNDESLTALLKSTLPFIHMEELKVIPIEIINQLRVVPPKVLETLSKRNYLSVSYHFFALIGASYLIALCSQEFPYHIRRLAWEQDIESFLKMTDDLINTYLAGSNIEK